MPHRKRPDLSPERQAQIDAINTTIREAMALVRAMSEQRTVIFRQLRNEGWKVTHLADLAGISPQRMSKILDPDSSSRPRTAPPRYDGWL